MLFINMIGKEFKYLGQRIIYPYIISYPEFLPIASKEASEDAQKQMYNFIRDALITIYNNPQIIGLSIDADDCFNGELFKDKPVLNDLMKKSEKKLFDFFEFLFDLGDLSFIDDGKLHIPKTKKNISKNMAAELLDIGIICEKTDNVTIIYSEEYPELCYGWKLLCNTHLSNEEVETNYKAIRRLILKFIFMKCIYNEENISFTSMYGNLQQCGTYLNKLENFFKDKGYRNAFKDSGFNMVKYYPNKQSSIFGVGFNWRTKYQLCYYIKISNFTTLFVQHFNEMDDELKQFVLSRTSHCGSCGYCTQTDKSRKRKPLAIQIEYNGETIIKCPLYPNLTWDEIDEKSIYMIKKMINFTEMILYTKENLNEINSEQGSKPTQHG